MHYHGFNGLIVQAMKVFIFPIFYHIISNSSNSHKTLLILLMSLMLSAPAAIAKNVSNTGSNIGNNSNTIPSIRKTKSLKKADVNPNDDDNDVWSYNLENNTYKDANTLNTTIDYSMKNGWDFQIAAYSIPVDAPMNKATDWDGYFNISKTFHLNDHWKALVGTQTGTNIFSETKAWHHFDFGLIILQIDETIDLHGGLYWANAALTGTTDVVDFTAGFSWEFVNEVWTLEGDYLHGHSGVSGATVNLFYRFLPNMKTYIGIGVPETHSGNEFFGAVGVNISSKVINL